MFLLVVLLFAGVSCQRNTAKAKDQEVVKTILYDKSLPEIKKYVNGKWELINGKNDTQECEYEDTFIEFDDDKYVWIEEGKGEPGNLNWRKAPTRDGYDSYLMDVFYETNPAYPLYIQGDTLFLQDCSKTAFKYKLVRK